MSDDALATLRRVLETNNKCRAAIWLRSGRTGGWYEWDSCNSRPGHSGNHQIWSDRDSDYWAEWADEGRATSTQVELDGEQRLKLSPWTERELAAYREVAGVGMREPEQP